MTRRFRWTRGATLALALAAGLAAPVQAQAPPAYQVLQIGEWRTVVVPSGVFFRRPAGTGSVSGFEILWGAVSPSDSQLRFLSYPGTDAQAGLEALAPLVPLSAKEVSYIKKGLLLASTGPDGGRAAAGSWSTLTEGDAKTLATKDLGVDVDPSIVDWGLERMLDGEEDFSVKTGDCTYKAEVRFLAHVYGGATGTPSSLTLAELLAGAAEAAASCTLAGMRPTGVPPPPGPATPPAAPSGPTVWAYDPCPEVGATSACVSPNWQFCTCQCNSSGVWQPDCSAGTPVPPVTPGGPCTTPGVWSPCGTGVCSCAANPTPPPANVWTPPAPPPPPPATGSLELLALAALAAAALAMRSLRRA